MKNSSIVSGTLRSLLSSWAISLGFLFAIVAMSPFISKVIVPLIVLVFSYLMTGLMNARRNQPRQRCLRMAWVVRTTLMISAFLMFLLLLLHVPSLFHGRFDAPGFNPRIPYISSIVIFTTGTVISLYAMFAGQGLGACKACRRVFGAYSDNSLASALFNEESSRQLRLFFWVSLAIASTQWGYFCLFFINVNFNSPDLFFFCYMPLAVYALSIGFLASRYYSINEAYRASRSNVARVHRGSQVRYLVTNGDNILLREVADSQWDTPYIAEVATPDVSEVKARERFDAMGGPADATLRFLYDNTDSAGEHFAHFAVFVPDESKDAACRSGRWLSLYEVDNYLNSGRLAPMLANELVRIYTITMAWKTYDREGRRLYPIKHYKPIFRLRDFKEWDVDYNDTSWLQVSVENEDKPFFRARRIWRKCHDIFHR